MGSEDVRAGVSKVGVGQSMRGMNGRLRLGDRTVLLQLPAHTIRVIQDGAQQGGTCLKRALDRQQIRRGGCACTCTTMEAEQNRHTHTIEFFTPHLSITPGAPKLERAKQKYMVPMLMSPKGTHEKSRSAAKACEGFYQIFISSFSGMLEDGRVHAVMPGRSPTLPEFHWWVVLIADGWSPR